MSKELKLTIPKIEFFKIVELLDEFGELAAAKGIKFNKYSELSCWKYFIYTEIIGQVVLHPSSPRLLTDLAKAVRIKP